VTACTKGRVCLFGEVMDGEMQLSEPGKLAQAAWDALPAHFHQVSPDAFIVMPNHMHGILWIGVNPGAIVGARHAVPLPPVLESFGKPVAGSLATIIRSYKSAATKQINQRRGTPGAAVWQRNYYEHVIRSDNSLNRIREYILDNPGQWNFDRENPAMPRRRAFLPQDEPWRV